MPARLPHEDPQSLSRYASGVKYITVDNVAKFNESDIGHSWSSMPAKNSHAGIWIEKKMGSHIGRVFIGDALKPGEIARIVKT